MNLKYYKKTETQKLILSKSEGPRGNVQPPPAPAVYVFVKSVPVNAGQTLQGAPQDKLVVLNATLKLQPPWLKTILVGVVAILKH